MATRSKNDPAAVDAYLATLPADERDALQKLRQLIKQRVPDVDERISYGTTVMFSVGRDLVGFVAQRNHLSFFTASPRDELRGKRIVGRKVSGRTAHFVRPGDLAFHARGQFRRSSAHG